VLCIRDVPDGHVGTGNNRETYGSGETLVTLRIIVLEADLEFDGFEEVSLLGLGRVLKELLDIGTHSGCGKGISNAQAYQNSSVEVEQRTDCDFRHDDSLPVELLTF